MIRYFVRIRCFDATFNRFARLESDIEKKGKTHSLILCTKLTSALRKKSTFSLSLSHSTFRGRVYTKKFRMTWCAVSHFISMIELREDPRVFILCANRLLQLGAPRKEEPVLVIHWTQPPDNCNHFYRRLIYNFVIKRKKVIRTRNRTSVFIYYDHFLSLREWDK